jgi:hypothetical protein
MPILGLACGTRSRTQEHSLTNYPDFTRTIHLAMNTETLDVLNEFKPHVVW